MDNFPGGFLSFFEFLRKLIKFFLDDDKIGSPHHERSSRLIHNGKPGYLLGIPVPDFNDQIDADEIQTEDGYGRRDHGNLGMIHGS